MSEARINDKFCFYCGDNSQITRDHVIPVSYTGGKRHYDRNDVVDCCMQCNSLLGNVPIHTVEERAEYLYEETGKHHDVIQVGSMMMVVEHNSMLRHMYSTTRYQ